MSSDVSEKKSGGGTVNPAAVAADLPDHLRRLDRLASLGLVSASVAHEIKNALVAVSTFVELLLEQHDDRDMAVVVQRELKRIDSLVTQMLRFASPKPASHASVNVHQLLDRSLRLLEHQMSGRKIALKREYHAGSASLAGDEFQLQQVVMNLLLNAVEAMSDGGGELAVATESGAGRMNISVRDTGGGIAPENLPHLFEPFFTTKKNGTGLGLAICRRVVAEHQGTIEVHSESGQGATFIISLPVE